MARKIQLNSAYGALGNQYFRFYDERQATAITTGGQLSIRWVQNDVNSYLNKILKTEDKDYIVAADTDSIYICLDSLVKSVFTDTSDKEKIIKFLDKVCETKIQDCINDSFNRLHVYMNAFEQKMNMSREVLADKAVWTGKKHYIMNVLYSEGVQYAKPRLKVMGLEIPDHLEMNLLQVHTYKNSHFSHFFIFLKLAKIKILASHYSFL